MPQDNGGETLPENEETEKNLEILKQRAKGNPDLTHIIEESVTEKISNENKKKK